MSDDRDYAEEAYWRDYCGECDGKCQSPDRHAAEIAAAQQQTVAEVMAEEDARVDESMKPTAYDELLNREAEAEWEEASSHPSYWSNTD